MNKVLLLLLTIGILSTLVEAKRIRSYFRGSEFWDYEPWPSMGDSTNRNWHQNGWNWDYNWPSKGSGLSKTSTRHHIRRHNGHDRSNHRGAGGSSSSESGSTSSSSESDEAKSGSGERRRHKGRN